MKKKCKVVILNVNKIEGEMHSSMIAKENNKLYNWSSPNYSYEKATFNNLYIISDDEIKEGDWCINANNRIVQFRSSVRNKESCKKIIATTDKLIINIPIFNSWKETHIPQIPQDFIKKFIESYNDGKVIEEVEVEYVDNGDEEWDERGDQPFWNEKLELSINPDNTISIHSVKDIFTREEVEKLFDEYRIFRNSNPNFSIYQNTQWIKEKLNK